MVLKQKELRAKLQYFSYAVLALIVLLMVKLAFVQFIQSDKYETLAKENRIRLVRVKASRGEIYDRNGKILAKNKRVYTVSLTYLGLKNQDKVVKRLVDIMHSRYPEVTLDYVQSLINQRNQRLYEPITIRTDIDWPMVVRLEEHRQELPGVLIGVEPLRSYPEGTLAGHVLGYVHPIYSETEMEKSYDSVNYQVGDLVGKDGLEKVYEKYLKGIDGAQRIEVDVSGRPVSDQIVTMEPKAGNNLVLTIDRNLQRVMEKSLDEHLVSLQRKNPKAKVAACILINVKTGEILAMASQPAMDPNVFTGPMNQAISEYYFPSGNQYDPLNPGAATNRAIKAAYPPGSTFKPITGMATLESGLDPNERFSCHGAYWIKPYIKCTGYHGSVDFFRGMAVSCNVYFQEAGRRAGKDRIIQVAQEFGLGQISGVDLPGEWKGNLPTPAWMKETNSVLVNEKYKYLRQNLIKDFEARLAQAITEEERAKINKEKEKSLRRLEANYKIDYNWETTWHQYNTFNMSIGQGDNSYTVMQLANYVATIANGGYRRQPYLVKKIVTPSGKVIKEFKPQLIKQVDVDPQIIAETRKAMHGVVSPGGTAYSVFSTIPSDKIGGAKTGTAQTGRRGDNKNTESHGVFIAFAPYDNPEIAFAGVIEYGGHGSSSAGLIAKDVFEQYFGVRDHLADEKLTPTNEETGVD
ncbi:MAG: penicillin-binding protein 2 [Chitinophagales bacterium]